MQATDRSNPFLYLMGEKTTRFIMHYDICYHMSPERIRERLAETEGRVDPREYVSALQYVRGGQSR